MNYKKLLLLMAALCFVFTSTTPLVHATGADAKTVFRVGTKSSFGAEGTQFVTDSMTSSGYSITLGGKATGYLLGWSAELANATAGWDIPNLGTSTKSSGSLVMFGKTYASWKDRTLNGNDVFRTPNTLARAGGGKARLKIGPVSVSLDAAGEVATYAQGQQTLEGSGSKAVKNLSAGPRIDGAATANMSADVWVASAGVDSNLKICGAGVTGRVKVTPRSGSRPKASWTITADLHEANGSIKGWLKVKLLGISKKFSKTFYEFKGGPSSKILSQGNR